MPDWKLEIDASAIASKFGELHNEVEEKINKAVGALAASTHAKVLELANTNLPKSLAPTYKEALSFKPLGGNIWVVSLDLKAAGWLENGRKCVVYGKNRADTPRVLTPDGHIRIDQVKKGMMVLNQFGKWTTVEEIYDEHIVQKSKMVFTKVEKSNYTPDIKHLHKRINIECVIGKCPVCDHKVYYKKWSKSFETDGIFCQKCIEQEKIVTIETPSKFTNKKTKNRNKMTVTGDHKIMTQRGWIEAWDLTEKDQLFSPSWSNCKTCKKDTYLGLDFCYCTKGSSCSSSYHIQKTFEKGTHTSQQPESRGRYLKTLNELQKRNKTEELFLDQASEFGYKTATYRDDLNINDYDFIREFPVKITANGDKKSTCYFIDFYCPKLNIGFEVDGKNFHSEKRDIPRDMAINKSINCDIIRIPAKNVWKKDFFKNNVHPILKNHSCNIKYLPMIGYKIKKSFIKANSSVCHRWDITVKDGESFICNGILIHNSGFMEELLHGKSSHQGKNGRYAIIPFKQNKDNMKDRSPEANDLLSQIKGFLKEKKISSTKLEFNTDGSPKMGLLHRFDIDSKKPSSKSKYPALSGVAIYQREVENKKTGKMSIKKEIMTFRVISESMKSDGRWVHPGGKAYNLIDEGFFWAIGEWDNNILPQILDSFKG